MKNFLRIISLMLAVLILASCFIGCEDIDANNEKDTSDNGTDDSVATPAPGEEGVEDVAKLPDMDWNGNTFTILGRDANNQAQFTNFEVGYDELPADVVGQAVYQRNDALKDKYNFIVEPILVPDVASTAQTSYTSGDDLYSLVICRNDLIQSHAQQGYLLDLNDPNGELKYVNLDNSSWYPTVNKELEIADKLYYTTNDFMLQDKHRYFYCFYNRGLASDLGLGYFEDMVDNNTWTLENVSVLTKQGYAELDGVSGPTNGDRYGLAYQNYYTFACLAMSAGLRITEKDANGYPVLAGATDKIMKVIDSVFKLTEDRSTWCKEDYPGSDDTYHPENMFIDGRVLLLHAFTSFIDYFLSVETGIEYGALPNPKYDSEQENYHVFPNVTGSGLLCVPYTVANREFVGFALEALTEESTNTSYTTYIDIKCKYQDAYDEDCARMLDLCLSNPIYEVAAFCDFGKLFTNLYSGSEGGLAGLGRNFYQRYFDSAKIAAQADIDKLIEEYEART